MLVSSEILLDDIIHDKLRKKYVGEKVFISRGVTSVDCGIFTDKNIGGYGKGIRGDYFFSDDEFRNALSEKGDYLKRRVFTLNNIECLYKHLELHKHLFYSEQYCREYVKDLIIKTRKSYCSANPTLERIKGVYVEIEDLFI